MLRLPRFIFCRHAHGARPVACGFRCAFIEEEHTVLQIAAAGDRLVRCTAGEAPVRPLPAMTPERARYLTLVRLAFRIQQRPGPLRHGASWNSRSIAIRH